MTDTTLELLERIRKIPVISAHEHLIPEEERLREKKDALSLFGQYTRLPMFASGLPVEQWDIIHDVTRSIETRYAVIKPYIEKIKYTSFARAVRFTLEHFWSVSELSEENIKEISEKIEASSQPGLYENILQRHCNIQYVLNQDTRNCGDLTDMDAYDGQKVLLPVVSLVDTKYPGTSYNKVGGGNGFRTLDKYLEWAKSRLTALAKKGAAGFKTSAYPYLNPDRGSADKEYNSLKKEGKELSSGGKPGYLFATIHDELLKTAEQIGLPVAVHTGFWGDFRELNPTHFIPVVRKFQGIHFDLFHAGVPYVRETGIMAVNFANISVNLCWAHSINASMLASALDEYIDGMGTDKIIGFGGDVAWFVEKVFGHLELARRNIADVLAGRIERNLMDVDEATALAGNWLFDNPARIYGLKV